MNRIERIKLFKKEMDLCIPLFRNNITSVLIRMGFFSAPASIYHHGKYEGALFDHSFAVMQSLLSLTRRLELKWQREESPYLIGMFHDLCKVDNYIHQKTLVGVNNNGKKYAEEWEYNNAQILPGHGDKSVIMLQQLLEKPPLTEEEILCIRWHMGAFDDKENWNSYGRAISKYPNVLYTHTADMIAAQILGV